MSRAVSRAVTVGSVLAALSLVAAACSSGGGPGGAGGAAAIEVVLTELKVTTSGQAPVGTPLSFAVRNDGGAPHSLALEHDGTTYETAVLNAGGSEALQVPGLPAGTYTLYCSVPGHREAGMEVQLTVGAGGAHGGTQALSPEEMDRLHREGVEAFPAKTDGLGGQVLAPKIVDGVKVFELTTVVVPWEVSPGKRVDAYAFNGVVPGPEIRVRRGDRIRVVLHNQMPESTSIHFHGLTVPNDMDGVPYINQDPVRTGESFTYAFTIKDPPGTHMYHSHHNATVQVGRGLLGSFVIEDPRPAWDAEHTLVLNDGPLGYTINGKGFPATAPVVAKLGEDVLIRFLNEGQQFHPMHLHGFHFRVVARDGIPLQQPYVLDTVTVAPGERWDVIATPTIKGIWAFHCHVLSHAESEHGMHGMVTVMVVE